MTLVSAAPARDPEPSAEASRRRSPLLVGAFVTVVVVGLVCYSWSRSDLWLDEALSVNIARLPLGQLQGALRHDGAPPLYYALLHVWTAVFGTSAVAVRSLSAVCMVGAVGAIWFVARRVGGRQAAWISVLLMASNPFAIRYATETRMYALEILLVACGMLAFQRALEAPTLPRLAVFGLVVALLVYTQYWTLYLLLVTAALLLVLAVRGSRRDAARRMLVAMAVAGLTFLPWLSAFLYQRAHTGTPWGTRILPGIPFGETLRDFAGGAEQEGWLLFFVLSAFLGLGVFGRGLDGRHVDVDLRGQPGARGVAIFGAITLFVALSLNYLANGAFQTRYSSLVFPFFIVLVARGLTVLRDPRVLIGALVVVVGLGFVGGFRNMATQRTQAGEVAAVLRREAKPGDVVVYCPDQVGPAVHRLAPSGLDEFMYPNFSRPERIDWVDYKKRLAQASVPVFARAALQRAGAHTLWYVSAPGYMTHVGTCETLSASFASARSLHLRTSSNSRIFEKPGLEEFPAPAAGG